MLEGRAARGEVPRDPRRDAAPRTMASDRRIGPEGAEQRGQRLHPWMRLRRGSEYARVYREGSRARGTFVTIAAAANGAEHSRIGLSIGKKVDKRAVVRNRLRRLVREAFRLEYPDLPKGFDLVAIGSTPGASPELGELRRELRRLAIKAVRRYAERHGERAAEPSADGAAERPVGDAPGPDPQVPA